MVGRRILARGHVRETRRDTLALIGKPDPDALQRLLARIARSRRRRKARISFRPAVWQGEAQLA
jgi:hypothetical protein